MQNSSAFQFLAIDTVHESCTNPRQSFEETKLHELAESIRQHGLIQPITVRPNADGFEIVAGARRFRAAQLAELFALPARIVELTDGQALEWQLVENSQRVDVHPYEEAQGFQRLLNMPGYDVATLAERSGKSTSHIYARLSLLQLMPIVAEAFTAERITASHANLLARLPQEHQEKAFEECWRKDWSDKEPHLLPAKHLAAWIQANLFLNLADAPFDREDPTLNPIAGACITCPRRTGYNVSLFCDVQGDQCLDAPCFRVKVEAHIDRELATRPELVQIETSWRPAKEQRPGVLHNHEYRELDTPGNMDTEPECESTNTALIVFGKNTGRTFTVCTDTHCPVHDPQERARRATEPAPVIAPAPEAETEEETQQREAEYEQRRREYEAEQERKTEERKQEQQRQQQERDAEDERRVELANARIALLQRIASNAPESFSAPQLRLLLRALLSVDIYSFGEEFAEELVADGSEDDNRATDQILLSALEDTADEKLTGFVLRLVLSEHRGIPNAPEPDFLTEAEALFRKPKVKAKSSKPAKAKKPTLVTKPGKSRAKKVAA